MYHETMRVYRRSPIALLSPGAGRMNETREAIELHAVIHYH